MDSLEMYNFAMQYSMVCMVVVGVGFALFLAGFQLGRTIGTIEGKFGIELQHTAADLKK